MRIWISAVVAAAVVTTSVPAHAQQDTEFRSLVDRGMRAYQSRQYDVAIQAFESAFALRPEPELIYNVARAYEKSLNGDKAIETYERFLRLQGTTAELRAKALASVEALRTEQRARARARRRPAEAAPPPSPPPAPAAARRTPVEVRQASPPTPRNRALEWSLIGGGAAIAAAGGVFAILAAMDNSEFDDSTNRAEQQDLKDSVERNALIADVLVPVGLVAAGVGVALFLINPDEDESVALSPLLTGDGGGVAFGGRF